jgi:hypothetical protein
VPSRFAANNAVKDLPGARDIQCPDEMHVDQRGQAAFTRALVAALRERGVLRQR